MKNNRIYKIDKNGKKRRVFWVYGLKVNFKGKNNTIIIHEPCVRFRKTTIDCQNGSTVIFKSSHTKLKQMTIAVSDGNYLEIGHNLLPNTNCKIRVYRESGLKVKIGDNCMMGPNVEIAASDAHCIYDMETKKVLNKGKDITIGNHVWMTTNVAVLKGVTIADNCIIATNSVVTKDCLKENCIYAGTPAKLIKENINWYYHFPKDGEYVENVQ